MTGRKEKFGENSEAGVGGFLGRWSKRKAEAKTAEAKTAEEAGTAAAVDVQDIEPASDLVAHEADAAIEQTDEPPAFDVASLPDIDTLGPGSDFTMFMQTGVPSELKNRALRKLWRVKPELANLDGLLDYGEDLTGSFKVVDHLKTAYEVGRGFLRDQGDEVETASEQVEDDGNMAELEAPDPETPTEQQAIADGADDVDAVDDRDEATDKA